MSGSAKTDPSCKARQRIRETPVADLARSSGGDLQDQVPAAGLLGGRPIKIADGTTVSMPDTQANQKAYSQQSSQKEGLGYPPHVDGGPDQSLVWRGTGCGHGALQR